MHILLYVLLFVVLLVFMLIKNALILLIGLALIIIYGLPIAAGITKSMMDLLKGTDSGITDFITIGLKNTYNVWKTYGRTILKLLPAYLLLVLAMILTTIFTTVGTISNSVSIILLAFGIGTLGTIASSIFLFIQSIKYSLSTYIMFDNPESTGKEIVEQSAKLMKGNIGNYIWLSLSFIPWYLLIYIISYCVYSFIPEDNILSVITSGFTLLLTPYIQASLIGFYETLKNETISNN